MKITLIVFITLQIIVSEHKVRIKQSTGGVTIDNCYVPQRKTGGILNEKSSL
jgi:hypothetical protein